MKSTPITITVAGLAALISGLMSGCQTERTVSVAPPPVTKVIVEKPNQPPTEVVTSPRTVIHIKEPPIATVGTDVIPVDTSVETHNTTTNRVGIVLANPPQSASSGLSELVKLLEAGVSEEVIANYIENAPMEYKMTADEIVYLRDLGASDYVITTIMNHSGSATEQLSVIDPAGGPIPGAEAPVDLQVQNPPQNASPSPAQNDYVVIERTPQQEEKQRVVVDSGGGQETVISTTGDVIIENTYVNDALNPYGTWVDVPNYGRCWQPTVAIVDTAWRPYHQNGRWLYTNCGWYWHSHYSWGGIPFHYGRWHRDVGIGWVWVPGSVWGPAWVSWRHYDSYVGWAPLPPAARFHWGVGFSWGGSRVGSSFAFGLAYTDYTFIGHRYFYDPLPWRHHVAYNSNQQIYENSTVNNNVIIGDNNTIINGGVEVNKIRAASRKEITSMAIRDVDASSGSQQIKPATVDQKNKTLSVYRPRLAARSSSISTGNKTTTTKTTSYDARRQFVSDRTARQTRQATIQPASGKSSSQARTRLAGSNLAKNRSSAYASGRTQTRSNLDRTNRNPSASKTSRIATSSRTQPSRTRPSSRPTRSVASSVTSRPSSTDRATAISRSGSTASRSVGPSTTSSRSRSQLSSRSATTRRSTTNSSIGRQSAASRTTRSSSVTQSRTPSRASASAGVSQSRSTQRPTIVRPGTTARTSSPSARSSRIATASSRSTGFQPRTQPSRPTIVRSPSRTSNQSRYRSSSSQAATRSIRTAPNSSRSSASSRVTRTAPSGTRSFSAPPASRTTSRISSSSAAASSRPRVSSSSASTSRAPSRSVSSSSSSGRTRSSSSSAASSRKKTEQQ